MSTSTHGVIKDQPNPHGRWRVWIFDLAGAADWGTYATRDEARVVLREGLAYTRSMRQRTGGE